VLAALVACVLAAMHVACDGEERGGSHDAMAGAVPSERMSAALRGVDWIVSHADELPDGWAHPLLLRLHRVAPDDETARRIEAVLRDDGAPSRRFPLPARLSDPRLLQPLRLMPILFELRRRKAVGEPYEAELEVLRRLLEARGGALLTRLPLTQRIVCLHQLRDLGLPRPYDFDSLFAEVEASVRERPIAELIEDRAILYAITHLVLVESGYFRRYVDAARYGNLLPPLRQALPIQLAEGAGEQGLDVAAEILACLSLLRQPDDEVVREARRRLIAAQDADGSWGDTPGVNPTRVHATLVGTFGTIELPATLRADPDLRKERSPGH